MSDYSFIGKGTLYLGPYANNAKRRSVGNAAELTLSVSETEISLPDFENAGGGKANSVKRIDAVTLAMTAHQISPENLAVAAFGSVTAVTAGTVTDEAHTAYQGGLVRLNNLPDLTQTITVTGASGTPVYTLGTDYTVTRAGIVIVEGGGITDGTAIEVDYTKLAGNLVQAVVNSAAEYKLTFDGLNEAQSGRAVVVDVHRWKPSPLGDLGLIGDDFAGLQMTGEVLKDAAITTPGLSQYFTVELAAAA